ncbi:hypothetical protein PLANTIT3_20038 [Plantibacter sp. T3]|nr:hypothetical protein PLANTIT3_20038 [Plantibacter sp. T3]
MTSQSSARARVELWCGTMLPASELKTLLGRFAQHKFPPTGAVYPNLEWV